MNLRGHLDAIHGKTVTGWVFDRDQPELKLHVAVTVNGKAAHLVPADEFRRGLLEKGLHPSGMCGFKVLLPSLKLGDEVRISINGNSMGIEPSERVLSLNPWTGARVFLMHIAKTGGTSFNKWAASRLPSNVVYTHLEGNPEWHPHELETSYAYLSGHLRLRRVMQILDLRSFFKVTVIRHPLEHLASHLAWVKRVGSDPSSAFFKSHTPEVQRLALHLAKVNFGELKELQTFFDNLEGEGLNLFDNCQTRYFLTGPVNGRLNETHLIEAFETYALFDRVVSINNMQELARDVAKLWHVESSEVELRNTQPERYGLNIKNPEVIDLLMPYTLFDWLIYQKCLNQSQH